MRLHAPTLTKRHLLASLLPDHNVRFTTESFAVIVAP